MNSLLVDTSAYSAFMRGNAIVVQEIQTANVLYISPIVLGELHSGFAAGSRQEQNEATLQEFLDSPRVQTMTIDEETSLFYATIYAGLRQAGTPIPTNDLWIAASAMQHGLVVLTQDSHFEHVAQIIVRLVV
jgi:predicted nucleic acid-binding protein